jgi:hypothetical protein
VQDSYCLVLFEHSLFVAILCDFCSVASKWVEKLAGLGAALSLVAVLATFLITVTETTMR